MADPQVNQIVGKGAIRSFLKKMAKSRRRHINKPGDIIDINFFSIVILNVITSLNNPGIV